MLSPLRLFFTTLCISAYLFVGTSSHAQVVLDTTFSHDGIRIDTNTYTAPYPINYQKIIELPDGSYVGGANNGIHKVLINGDKDISFGVNGAANFPNINGYVYDGVPCVKSIALQRDGKIVVLAQVKYSHLVNPFMCLMRYTENGILDNSFHNVGYFIDSLSGHSTQPWGMTIDTVTHNNKDVIYLCGTYGHCVNIPNGGSYCSDGFYVMAVGPTGNYETDFKQGGIWTGFVIPYHTSGQDYFTSLHVISPNNLILQGITLANTYGYYALKVNSMGTIDSTFGVNGLWEATDSIFSFSRYAFSKQSGSDKLILFHSTRYDTDSTYITYQCIDTTGHTVTSFGQNGHIVQSMNLNKDIGSFALWFPIAIDPGGRIYTCTYSKPNASSYIHILRMLPDGSRDASFGNNGMLITEPIINDNCLNGNIMWDALITRNNKLVLSFQKDYNINAMSFGGGIYRYKAKPDLPFGMQEGMESDLQIGMTNGQLVISSSESGIHQIKLYNLSGQLTYSTSLYLQANQLSNLNLPILSSGIYIAGASLGQKKVTRKVFIGK